MNLLILELEKLLLKYKKYIRYLWDQNHMINNIYIWNGNWEESNSQIK